jgi:hypothetical protein
VRIASPNFPPAGHKRHRTSAEETFDLLESMRTEPLLDLVLAPGMPAAAHDPSASYLLSLYLARRRSIGCTGYTFAAKPPMRCGDASASPRVSHVSSAIRIMLPKMRIN